MKTKTVPALATREQMMSYTVSDIMKRLKVSQKTVLAWIHTGELQATDVSRYRDQNPRWRVSEEALAAFELSRMKTPPVPQTRRRHQPEDSFQVY